MEIKFMKLPIYENETKDETFFIIFQRGDSFINHCASSEGNKVRGHLDVFVESEPKSALISTKVVALHLSQREKLNVHLFHRH